MTWVKKVVILGLFLIVLAACVATACEAESNRERLRPQRVEVPYSELRGLQVVCLEGVEYWWLGRDLGMENGVAALAPKYRRDGTVSQCPAEK